MRTDLWLFLGSAEKSPSTSERIISLSASTSPVTSEARLSLSPNFISSVATVSFSLIIGIMPYESSVLSVFLELIYLFLSVKSSRVSSTCADFFCRIHRSSFISPHQTALPYSSSSLFELYIFRFLLQAEFLMPAATAPEETRTTS